MFKDKTQQSAADTYIGQGTLTEGKLLTESNLRIEGEYRGDIQCNGHIMIGEFGIARGNMTGQDVTLAGKVYGDIIAQGRMLITSSGQMYGNISAKTIIIQEGGSFVGECQMLTEQSTDSQENNKKNENSKGKAN